MTLCWNILSTNRSEHDAIGFGVACGILTPVVFSCCCAPCLFAAWCEDSLRPTCCPPWCAEIAPAVATTIIPMVVASMAACPHHNAPIMVAYIFHLLASTVACIRVGFASCYAKGHTANDETELRNGRQTTRTCTTVRPSAVRNMEHHTQRQGDSCFFFCTLRTLGSHAGPKLSPGGAEEANVQAGDHDALRAHSKRCRDG